MNDIELINLAKEARNNAYTPYSNFKVGAALLCSDGSVFKGCNIENAAYSPTICAERSAIASAVCAGHTDFVKIAVAGSGEGICTPCGVCRQTLYEFNPDMTVICTDNKDGTLTLPLKELLPHGFGPANLR